MMDEDGPWRDHLQTPPTKTQLPQTSQAHQEQQQHIQQDSLVDDGLKEKDTVEKETSVSKTKRESKKPLSQQPKPNNAKYLRRGVLLNREKERQEHAKQRRKLLDERTKQQPSIVYRKDRSVEKRKRFHPDTSCARSAVGGVGSAVPKGFSDRLLVEALERAASNGDQKALRKLQRIHRRQNEQTKQDKETRQAPVVVKRREKPSQEKVCLKTSFSVGYKSGSGRDLLAITSTPREPAPIETVYNNIHDLLVYKNLDIVEERTPRFLPSKQVETDEGDVEEPMFERTTLAQVLAWYSDEQLREDDTILREYQRRGWEELKAEEERLALEQWLAEPEYIPSKETTSTQLVWLEFHAASFFAPAWISLVNGEYVTSEVASQLPAPESIRSGTPASVLDFWFSTENEAIRRLFIDQEVLAASKDTAVLKEASKLSIEVVQPGDELSQTRQGRGRWRAFRGWYLKKAGAMVRTSFLGRETQRLLNAWNSQWARWKRLEATIGRHETNETQQIDDLREEDEDAEEEFSDHEQRTHERETRDLYPLRWKLVQAFLPERNEILEEYEFNSKWGASLIWHKMTAEEKTLELQAALCDRLILSLAKAEQLVPENAIRKVHDDDGEFSDSDTEGEEEYIYDFDRETLAILAQWFAGNVHVREAFLRREMECAAGDFAREKTVFNTANEENCPGIDSESATTMRSRLSAVFSAPAVEEEVDFTQYSFGKGWESAVQVFEQLEKDDLFRTADGDQVEDLHEGEYAEDREIALVAIQYESLQASEQSSMPDVDKQLQERRRESLVAQRDLALAQALFQRLSHVVTEEEEMRLRLAEEKLEEEIAMIQQKARESSMKAASFSNKKRRVSRMEEIDRQRENERQEAIMKSKALQIAERRRSTILRLGHKFQVNAIEVIYRLTQRKVLQAMREKINLVRGGDGHDSDGEESSKEDSVETIQHNGKVIQLSGKNWDSTRELRDQVRKEAIQELAKGLSHSGHEPSEIEQVLQEAKREFHRRASTSVEDVSLLEEVVAFDAREYLNGASPSSGGESNLDESKEKEDVGFDTEGIRVVFLGKQATEKSLRRLGISFVGSEDTRRPVSHQESRRSKFLQGNWISEKFRRSSGSLLLGGPSKTHVDWNDERVSEFRSWYSANKGIRKDFLHTRVQKFQTFCKTMQERGEKVSGVNVFDEEEVLEPPPVSPAILRKMKLLRLRRLAKKTDLSQDDKRMEEAEELGRQELAQELERLQQLEMERLRKRLREDLHRELQSAPWQDLDLEDDQNEMASEDTDDEVMRNQECALSTGIESVEEHNGGGDQAVDVEPTTIQEQDQEKQDQEEEQEKTEENVDLGEFFFSDEVKEEDVSKVDQARWVGGSGLFNGDEEWEAEQERIRELEKSLEAEKAKERAELEQMRAEDEALRKFYINERRQLLLAAEEAELNRLVLAQREEERQRREHPLGLCQREVLELDRREMAKEDAASKACWKELDEYIERNARLRREHEVLMKRQQQELEERLQHERETLQALEAFEARVCQRELTDMGVEDTRASLIRPFWEDERHRLERLRWMEKIAYMDFKPHFSGIEDVPVLLDRGSRVFSKNNRVELPKLLRDTGRGKGGLFPAPNVDVSDKHRLASHHVLKQEEDRARGASSKALARRKDLQGQSKSQAFHWDRQPQARLSLKESRPKRVHRIPLGVKGKHWQKFHVRAEAVPQGDQVPETIEDEQDDSVYLPFPAVET